MYKENYRAFQKRFGANLSREIKAAGFSQRKQILAGLDPPNISRIKRGEKNITLKTIHKICKAIGIDPMILFLNPVNSRRKV